jgi:hypothetical protein
MIHTRAWVSCDACGRDTPPAVDLALVVAWMVRCGWHFGEGAPQRHYCDKCNPDRPL